MKASSNVRCYLPKHQAVQLVAVFQQIDLAKAKLDGYSGDDDFAKSIDEAYRVIRERMAKGGPGWTQKGYKQP